MHDELAQALAYVNTKAQAVSEVGKSLARRGSSLRSVPGGWPFREASTRTMRSYFSKYSSR